MKRKCLKVRVIDGDTVVMHVQMPSPLPGLDFWAHNLRCRLARIKCEEMSQPGGFKARARMQQIWEQGGEDAFLVDVVKADKYGLRWDVELYCGAVNINDLMAKDGFATPYFSSEGDDMDLLPYPTSMPDGWMLHLISLWRNRDTIDLKIEAHFLWHVGGVAMNNFVSSDGLNATAAADPEDCCKQLEASGGLQADGSLQALPWSIILPIVIALIRKYMGI